MGFSPFAKRPSPQDSGASQRRSTRVDYGTPIVLTGRDASGLAFREETETSIVNLHGCKLSTTHQVLVGMLVTLESLRAKMTGKAVCVHIWDPAPGESAHDIAVQLLKPQNLWGLENPPPDWQKVAETMVHGLPLRAPASRATPAEPERIPAPPPAPPKVPASPFSILTADTQRPSLDERAARLTESVLQSIRIQAEEVFASSVEEFRQQVDVLVKVACERIRERAEQSYDKVESSLTTLRSDLAEQLSHRTEQVVDSAEEALRTKVAEMFATLLNPAPSKPSKSSSKK